MAKITKTTFELCCVHVIEAFSIHGFRTTCTVRAWHISKQWSLKTLFNTHYEVSHIWMQLLTICPFLGTTELNLGP